MVDVFLNVARFRSCHGSRREWQRGVSGGPEKRLRGGHETREIEERRECGDLGVGSHRSLAQDSEEADDVELEVAEATIVPEHLPSSTGMGDGGVGVAAAHRAGGVTDCHRLDGLQRNCKSITITMKETVLYSGAQTHMPLPQDEVGDVGPSVLAAS